MFPEDRFLEILIIGALALIVIGPKDLPVLMRRLGQFIGRMRGMAAEFRASFDELARQSELDELRKEVEALRHTQSAFPPPAPSEELNAPQADGGSIAGPALGSPPAAPVQTPPAGAGDEAAAPPAKPPRKPRSKAVKPTGAAP